MKQIIEVDVPEEARIGVVIAYCENGDKTTITNPCDFRILQPLDREKVREIICKYTCDYKGHCQHPDEPKRNCYHRDKATDAILALAPASTPEPKKDEKEKCICETMGAVIEIENSNIHHCPKCGRDLFKEDIPVIEKLDVETRGNLTRIMVTINAILDVLYKNNLAKEGK